jgi:hypothetical protein
MDLTDVQEWSVTAADLRALHERHMKDRLGKVQADERG